MAKLRWRFGIAAILAAFLIGGCTGGSESDSGDDGGEEGPEASVTSIQLRANSTTLGTGGDDSVALTAVALDDANRVVAGAPVSFSASSGQLVVDQGVTDDTGVAIATLSAGANPANRTITVRAESGGGADSFDVAVSGTSLTIDGPRSITQGARGNFVIRLADFSGNGIPGRTVTIDSAQGNTIESANLTTDSSGRVEVTLIADRASAQGTDTLTASALGIESDPLVVNIAGDALDFETPAEDAEIPINAERDVSVSVRRDGAPAVAGERVRFTTTRGTIDAEATTDASGVATVALSSATAGEATIAASTTDSPVVTGERSVEFVAVSADSVNLSSAKSAVRPTEETVVTAQVRDGRGNLVKNARVNFNLSDPTGGILTNSSAVTDSAGSATTVYRAGDSDSAQNEVVITATVQSTDQVSVPNPPVRDEVALSVSQVALRITLGTGNEMEETGAPDSPPTQYQEPWVVQVTDTNGAAVSGSDVEVRVTPLLFYKGQYNATDDGWVANRVEACGNEDDGGIADPDMRAVLSDPTAYPGALNGRLDAGEDRDGDGLLEPGNVASVPASVETDDNGFAFFDITYPKGFGNWVRIRLTVTATVSGTESQEFTDYDLRVLADDVDDTDVTPPGGVASRFGTSAGCGNPD